MTIEYQPLSAEASLSKPASPRTRAANEGVQNSLNFDEHTSFEDARRGFISSLKPMTILHANGSRPVYDLSHSSFLDGEAPDTVNPSLWRQAQLNAQHHGLFEVVEGIYQIRSFDIANMTLIRGETGWIVVDPLTASEASAAGLKLANEQLGPRPVVAVIHTHSHADHYAGVMGVVSQEDLETGRVPILAPEDFVKEALSENVLAGNVMNRRATYMYGNLLKPGPDAFVTTGLGAALAMGSTGFAVPTDTITTTGETRIIDGIEIEFQMTMGTEAPSEMVFYFPQFKALCMSEITSHHMHNLYTPRGAQIRDALAWSEQIHESITLFGHRIEVQFASHHWPIWGREKAVAYLSKQRDLYKYIHDQTLRLANHGFNMDEIAEQISLPNSLGQEFYNRSYYGHLHFNVRAVYNKYLGFFDGNPANLYKLPPTEAGKRYIEYMGGADEIVRRATLSFDEGDYRWVAEVLNHIMMVDPTHEPARALLADSLEQLGYQTESGPWRNFFLCGALELRQGLPKGSDFGASESMARNIPLSNLFQTMSVRLHGPRADGVRLSLNLNFDQGLPWHLLIDNSVLHAFEGSTDDEADATLSLDEVSFKRLMMGLTDAVSLIESGALKIDGDISALTSLSDLFDKFSRRFPIVTRRVAN